MQKQKVLAEFKMGLGDIVISIVATDSEAMFTVNSTRKRFSTDYEPDIILRMRCSDTFPPCQLKETIFASDGLWSLFRSQGRYILCGKSDPAEVPDRIVVISSDFRSGDIYIDKQKIGLDFSCGYPLEYPLDEILIVNLLARRRGIMVHACGVKDDRRGLLFAGTSQAGKSTMANLWKLRIANDKSQNEGVSILSDDRIIIRKKEGKFWIYGTPWHGDAKVCSPERTPVEKIFFLKHAKKNSVKKIKPLEAASRLIVRSFPTFWDKKGMEFTLKFCAELAQKVPCYELGFVPDESVLDFVRDK